MGEYFFFFFFFWLTYLWDPDLPGCVGVNPEVLEVLENQFNLGSEIQNHLCVYHGVYMFTPTVAISTCVAAGDDENEVCDPEKVIVSMLKQNWA